LNKLFSDARAAEEQLEQAPTSYGSDAPVSVKGPTPGMIGPSVKKQPPKPKAAPKDPDAIWDAAEVGEAGDAEETEDGRPQPEYEIVFKQSVSAEDMFLGIDPLRNAGVACSDALVLKVQLPDTKLSEIDLDVRPTFVRVLAPSYRLKAYLPERVDEQKGDAKWDAAKGQLTVTLPVISSFDSKMPVSSSNELD